MTAQLDSLIAQLMATDTAALPSPTAIYLGMRLGWSVVLAWLCVSIALWRKPAWHARAGRLWLVALLAAASTWLAGAYGSAYWLGLVFQMPSAMAIFLCALLLWRLLRGAPVAAGSVGPSAVRVDRVLLVQASLGVLLGWVLLLDSFALLPVQLYAFGFSPLASGLLMLGLLLPWVLFSKPGSATTWRAGWCLAPVSMLACAVLRLPSGNAWDAVLDPLLWLGLHAFLLRAALAYRRRSIPRPPAGA